MSKRNQNKPEILDIDTTGVVPRIKELNQEIAEHQRQISVLRGECQGFVIEIQNREKVIINLTEQLRSKKGGIIELQKLLLEPQGGPGNRPQRGTAGQEKVTKGVPKGYQGKEPPQNVKSE